jgi:general stress protein 26
MPRTLKIFATFFSLFLLVIFSLTALAQAPKSSQYQRDSLIAGAREIMGLQKYCALITVDSSHQANVRTMNPFPPESDMTVWMATNSRSRKAEEIRHNPNVCLYYADHAQARGYVSIKGKAILVDDMQEKLKRKREYWTEAFPDWKYLLLIKVVPEKIEVINYSKNIVNDSLTWMPPTIDFTK